MEDERAAAVPAAAAAMVQEEAGGLSSLADAALCVNEEASVTSQDVNCEVNQDPPSYLVQVASEDDDL